MSPDRRAQQALVAAAAGLLAMGAAPVSGEAAWAKAEAAIAKILPSPRLYRVTLTGATARPLAGRDMCVGAELIRTMMRGPAQRAGAVAGAAKGCTLTYIRRPDGSFRAERTCDRVAGAASTSHIVMEGTAKEMRQHMERVMESAQSDEPRIVALDTQMTDLGPCPTGMKPGQIRTAAGEIIDAPTSPGR